MSSPLHLHISAVDSLMFRDGRPFNQNDAGASEAASVFPPHPPTIVGATRATLWNQLGGVWPKNGCLGNGTNWQAEKNILGPLLFSAPLVLKDCTPVFPVPLHILEGKDADEKAVVTRLSPSHQSLKCDLGSVRLPVPDESGLLGIKPIEDRWITTKGMMKILDGRVDIDNDLIKRTDIWRTEPRVGIGIDAKTRTTNDGQLYMASHVRMEDDVSLYVDVQGWAGDFTNALRPFAGEHRMAEITNHQNGVELPATSVTNEDEYCAILISPMVLEKMPKPGDKIGDLPGTLVSACLGKPVSIGGWDSEAKTPIPLRQCIPAGSVFFMEKNDGTAKAHHLKHIGKSTEWGFGQILIGKWQEKN